jgi:sugar fermentation stimulation protein A
MGPIVMKSSPNLLFPPLHKGLFVKRYKRFLCDIHLKDELITVHCPNSGSMKSCLTPGGEVYLSYHTDPKRKYPYTLELTKQEDGLVCVQTHRANSFFEKIWQIPKVQKFFTEDKAYLSREVTYKEGTRFDFCIEFPSSRHWLEIKSVSLFQDGFYAFPDAPTIRGHKHLEHLQEAITHGDKASIIYVLMRGDLDIQKKDQFRFATLYDQKYQTYAQKAFDAGVGFYLVSTEISLEGMGFKDMIRFKEIPLEIKTGI